MLVELCVQDHFQDLSPQKTPTPITTETWEEWFHQWLNILHPDIPAASMYEIGLRFTNDIEIQELNAQYRHQNKPTDVLAFAELEVDCPQVEEMEIDSSLYLGDIVISVDTANRQAQEQGHLLSTELAWLVCHGLLHLLGWDHPDDESLERMLEQQVQLLTTIGITIDIK